MYLAREDIGGVLLDIRLPDSNGLDTCKINLSASEKARINLTVSDNGIVLPPEFDIDTTQSLGLHLVKILVEDQLQGNLELISNQGTTLIIEFNIR
jgi:two-component sensor histidine kinase